MTDIPREIQDLVKQMGCRFCGTPNGRGFVVNVSPEEQGVFVLTGRCLRCGAAGVARLIIRKDETTMSTNAGPQESDISTDEVIDLHEALKSNDWLAQMTGKKP